MSSRKKETIVCWTSTLFALINVDFPFAKKFIRTSTSLYLASNQILRKELNVFYKTQKSKELVSCDSDKQLTGYQVSATLIKSNSPWSEFVSFHGVLFN